MNPRAVAWVSGVSESATMALTFPKTLHTHRSFKSRNASDEELRWKRSVTQEGTEHCLCYDLQGAAMRCGISACDASYSI